MDSVRGMDIIDVDRFIADGFVKVEAAVPRAVGDQARALLWEQIGLSPEDRAGWREPVVWALGIGRPFVEVSGSARVGAALDLLAGPGGWVPWVGVGNIPIRFPRVAPADDRGWHLDASVALPGGEWAVGGRPESLLMLTLYSEVGPDDAPTRIRVGSHRDAAAVLAGRIMDPFEAGPVVDAASAGRPVAYATGSPGDVYLVHPFTVHAADEHRGGEPRFMSQTPVFLSAPLEVSGDSVLARAVR